jgi:uroporphyrinogen-III decarboxylase
MNNQMLLREREARIRKAIALERPDRTPVVLLYALFAARVTGMPFPDFCSSISGSAEAMIETFRRCGDADGTDYIGFYAYDLSRMWMSKVKLPGRELPDNVAYQVSETELMKVEDYDDVLRYGWEEFYDDYLQKRVLDDLPPSLRPGRQPVFNARSACDPLGIPVLTPGSPIVPPFDKLCGGRSMVRFIHDLYTIPDKVEAVMDAMVPTACAAAIATAKEWGYPATWVGGWRSASANLEPALWERFVWPYLQGLVQEVTGAGLVAILHLDGDWTRDLNRFRELPRGRCILATDGTTDLFKAKEILGDHMCLMGDVPAVKLTMGTPDDVYAYSSRLIRELGPEGFILHSGCDIPANARLENVKAMICAATGK